jgi:hypothetical protein
MANERTSLSVLTELSYCAILFFQVERLEPVREKAVPSLFAPKRRNYIWRSAAQKIEPYRFSLTGLTPLENLLGNFLVPCYIERRSVFPPYFHPMRPHISNGD